MFVRAPTLAWVLTAVTCFLAGLLVTEARHEAVAPVAPALNTVVTVEVDPFLTATPAPTLPPTAAATPTPCAPTADAPARPGCTGNAR
jgi:hypothetical protein